MKPDLKIIIIFIDVLSCTFQTNSDESFDDFIEKISEQLSSDDLGDKQSTFIPSVNELTNYSSETLKMISSNENIITSFNISIIDYDIYKNLWVADDIENLSNEFYFFALQMSIDSLNPDFGMRTPASFYLAFENCVDGITHYSDKNNLNPFAREENEYLYQKSFYINKALISTSDVVRCTLGITKKLSVKFDINTAFLLQNKTITYISSNKEECSYLNNCIFRNKYFVNKSKLDLFKKKYSLPTTPEAISNISQCLDLNKTKYSTEPAILSSHEQNISEAETRDLLYDNFAKNCISDQSNLKRKISDQEIVKKKNASLLFQNIGNDCSIQPKSVAEENGDTFEQPKDLEGTEYNSNQLQCMTDSYGNYANNFLPQSPDAFLITADRNITGQTNETSNSTYNNNNIENVEQNNRQDDSELFSCDDFLEELLNPAFSYDSSENAEQSNMLSNPDIFLPKNDDKDIFEDYINFASDSIGRENSNENSIKNHFDWFLAGDNFDEFTTFAPNYNSQLDNNSNNRQNDYDIFFPALNN